MSELLIVGTGALAGLFGGRLAPHADVTLLGSWKEAIQALNREGLTLQDNGSFVKVPIRATAEPSDVRGVRHALVLVKAWQTEEAATMLAECLAEDGLALTLQNGLGNLEILQATLGAKRAALGVTTSGANLVGPAHVRVGGSGVTHVAEHPGLEVVVDLLEAAGFEVRPATDLSQLVWGKLAVNAAINPLTALLEIPNGELLNRPEARKVMRKTAAEVAEVAAAKGIRLAEDPGRLTEQVARRTAENISSMLQDVRRGAPTEIEAINGAVVREADRQAIDVPFNRILWHLIKAKVAQ